MMTALTLAWARSLGEFGPLLIFAGATRMKTEVLSTTVFLEMNVGNLEAAVAVSLIMVAAAVVVLIVARLFGTRAWAFEEPTTMITVEGLCVRAGAFRDDISFQVPTGEVTVVR
jgi:ABC-type sulfate transport system permease subunit